MSTQYKCDRCGVVETDYKTVRTQASLVSKFYDLCSNCYAHFHVWMKNK